MNSLGSSKFMKVHFTFKHEFWWIIMNFLSSSKFTTIHYLDKHELWWILMNFWLCQNSWKFTQYFKMNFHEFSWTFRVHQNSSKFILKICMNFYELSWTLLSPPKFEKSLFFIFDVHENSWIVHELSCKLSRSHKLTEATPTMLVHQKANFHEHFSQQYAQ